MAPPLWLVARGQQWARPLFLGLILSATVLTMAAIYQYPEFWIWSYWRVFFQLLLLLVIAWPTSNGAKAGVAFKASMKGNLVSGFAAFVGCSSAFAAYVWVTRSHDTGGLEGGAGLNQLGAMIFAAVMLFIGGAFGALIGATLGSED